MLSRFIHACWAIITVLLQRALLTLEVSETEVIMTQEALIQLCRAFRTVHTFLISLVCQLQRIHLLLVGAY